MAWRDHLQSSRVRARTMFIASSPHLWLPLLLATICAALAYVIATRSLQAAEQRLVQQHAAHGRARQVIVAARRLSPGTRLQYDMLAQRAVPGQYVPRAALTVDQLDAAVGASPRVVLEPGDILVAGVLEPARHAALADRLAVGERALTITVDDAASQAGLLRPGDRIDLLYVEPPDRATGPCSSP